MARKKILTREIVTKDLWTSFDATTIALKQLQDTVTGPKVALWSSLETIVKKLRYIDLVDVGDRVLVERYGSEKMIVDVLAFIPHDGTVKVKTQVIASLTEQFDYVAVDENMQLDVDDFITSKPIELAREDLPLYVSWVFKGTIYDKMLKGD